MTLANAPLSARDARTSAIDLPDGTSEIFLQRNMDTPQSERRTDLPGGRTHRVNSPEQHGDWNSNPKCRWLSVNSPEIIRHHAANRDPRCCLRSGRRAQRKRPQPGETEAVLQRLTNWRRRTAWSGEGTKPISFDRSPSRCMFQIRQTSSGTAVRSPRPSLFVCSQRE
jgi:hypothetical protein